METQIPSPEPQFSKKLAAQVDLHRKPLYHITSIPLRADPLLGECKIGIEELLHRSGPGKIVKLDVTADNKAEAASEKANNRIQITVGTLAPVGPAFDATVKAGDAVQSEAANVQAEPLKMLRPPHSMHASIGLMLSKWEINSLRFTRMSLHAGWWANPKYSCHCV
ncbi:hypothetical protein B0H16DRAFT_1690938 [Mycena metata]|uniref:Uncharacterized protein n=1 Tax=Mycena metata TaxID=1033252 RepID=A0AAD7IZG2_9AGAR|nr:hypothetical protein B0H16DRAFT_1690938 [Mycena metata]